MVMASFTFAQSNREYTNTLSQMLEKSGSQESFKIVLGQTTAMLQQQKKDVPDNVWEEINDDLSKSALKELTILFSPVYEQYLTLEDLKAVIAFYNTPIGKKFAQKTPLITTQSMQVGQQWAMQLMPKIQGILKEKGC